MKVNQAKKQARNLERFLKKQGMSLPYSQCLEAIAVAQGVANWQTLQAHEAQPQLVPVTVRKVATIWEMPFIEGRSGELIITQVLVADSVAEEKRGTRTYHTLRHVDEDMLELLANEARGEPLSADDLELLEDEDTLLFDWGDEYEAEGLYLHEVRGMTQIKANRWQLPDGRTLSFIAQAEVSFPMK